MAQVKNYYALYAEHEGTMKRVLDMAYPSTKAGAAARQSQLLNLSFLGIPWKWRRTEEEWAEGCTDLYFELVN